MAQAAGDDRRIGVVKVEPLAPDQAELTRWLVDYVAAAAGIPVPQIDPAQPFSAYGFDSMTTVSLSGDLEAWLGRSLPPTLAYDYPDIQSLATYLAAPADQALPAAHELRRDEIAIIGLGCRFPGASDPAAFWALLAQGHDAVAASSARVEGLPSSGLLDQVDGFDAEFFAINPREAEAMDPQQRLLLEVAWETLEHAGVAAPSLAGSRTAVMVGISNIDYARLTQSAAEDSGPYAATGGAMSIAANRISYTLDLRGPSWAVDTACSSSLVAVHQACRALLADECDAALAGGVNLILAAPLSAAFANAGMLSPDGQCRAFDAGANGYVRGEGAGMVLLKRHADAVRDGDTVLALIRGSAVNQDGRSHGLTAPNGPAQRLAIRAALARSGVDAKQIGYIEAHGTGTPLGDPIELNALVGALSQDRQAQALCHVGSVKSNIGHLESAAGIASLIKVVLALGQRQIPPTLHYHQLNPQIELAGTPFRVAEQLIDWPLLDGARLAGVSSFGFGGTNAHVVLAEAPAARGGGPAHAKVPVLLPLSARDDAALADLFVAYRQWLRDVAVLDLDRVAYTAQTGRAHFACRAALVVNGEADLRAQLDAWERRVPATAHSGVAWHIEAFDGSARELWLRWRTEAAPLMALLDDELALLSPEASDQEIFELMQRCLMRFWLRLGLPPRALIGSTDKKLLSAEISAVSIQLASVEEARQLGYAVLSIGVGAGDWTAILRSVAEHYAGGANIDWSVLHTGLRPARAILPTYPFQRRRHWLSQASTIHPLLGRRHHGESADGWIWQALFDDSVSRRFAGHRVMGTVILPYAAYVEMALSAAAEIDAGALTDLADLVLHAPLLLDQGQRMVRTVLSPGDQHELDFSVYQRAGVESAWQLCASAKVQRAEQAGVLN